jgi:hypothetical protein
MIGFLGGCEVFGDIVASKKPCGCEVGRLMSTWLMALVCAHLRVETI